MLGVLVKAPRGLFYIPKGPRSDCSFLWKLLIALYPRVHWTIQYTPDILVCNGNIIKKICNMCKLKPKECLHLYISHKISCFGPCMSSLKLDIFNLLSSTPVLMLLPRMLVHSGVLGI
jgi:hypothetical protein